MIDPQAARNVLEAVRGANRATTALFEALNADAAGELEEGDLCTVIEDYLSATATLENARRTRGLIPA